MRYVALHGMVKRAISVLKMRGSMHDKDIREIMIDHRGMHIGAPLRNVGGVLAGAPKQIDPDSDPPSEA